jgi:hypothetical protein
MEMKMDFLLRMQEGDYETAQDICEDLLEEDPNALGKGMKDIFAQFQEMLPVEVEDQLAAEAEPEEFETSSDEEKQQEEEEEED